MTMSQAFHSLFPGPVLPQVDPVSPAEPEQLEQSAKAAAKKPPRGRVRARNPQGEFVGDDPSTPDVNEAYVLPEEGNTEA
jgi:hypothetical protein